MATKQAKMKAAQKRRKMRVRKRVSGTAERPRLSVFRSLRYMTASLIDDDRGVTIVGATTKKMEAEGLELPEKPEKFKIGDKKLPLTGKVADAFRLGLVIATKAKEAGISQVVFDRNGQRYHGRVRAVAEGARKGGLEL
jgi:large subunit ribosomal protein L18